ncbi:50S ribosomal protein L11 methyltransferase, partial [Turicibacter sanguinis]|nr:50S ribosomal protein L11 methyltransferase [Turicibacter sanguinis]
MLDDVVKVLPQGQTFICSGIVDHEKQAVLDALVAHQFKIEEVREKNGWVAIVATYEG